jgi:hypothetical protein
MAILEHTLGIFLHPNQEWKKIRNERHSFIQVFISHMPILAFIPVVAAYYGVTQVGWSVTGDEVVRLTPESALVLCGFTYLAQLVAVYVLGEYINWMAHSFGVKDGGDRRHYEGTALSVYAATPLMLAGTVMFYPEPWVVVPVYFAAIAYAVYLLYRGTPILMNIPKGQAFIYASSIVTIGLVLSVVVMISTVILWGMGFGPVYID